jgi:DNA-binding response OmpR family regulator
VTPCVRCERPSAKLIGVLCARCSAGLARGDEHVPGTVSSTVPGALAEAWLIDPWGQCHAIADGTMVASSSRERAIVIVDRRVSREHAVFRRHGPAWIVEDLGSGNHTDVGDEQRVERAALEHLVRVRFAATIGFYVWARSEPPALRIAAPEIETHELRVDSYRIQAAGRSAALVPEAGCDRADPRGWLVFDDGTKLRLSRLRYQLLSKLCERRRRAGTDDARAFAGSQELIAGLEFKTANPDLDNLTTLVLEVRKKLREVGFGELIESQEGRGYRLAAAVTIPPPG